MEVLKISFVGCPVPSLIFGYEMLGNSESAKKHLYLKSSDFVECMIGRDLRNMWKNIGGRVK